MNAPAEFLDYYAILGAAPTADEQTLREAYREAARSFHPDVNKSSGAAVLFRDINKAYEVLSDPQRRMDYDLLWRDRSASAPEVASKVRAIASTVSSPTRIFPAQA